MKLTFAGFPLNQASLTLVLLLESLHDLSILIVDEHVWSIYLNRLTETVFVLKTHDILHTLSKCHA